MDLGILGPERQSALVRTWGRSYARLAEWQTALLADVALEKGADPAETLAELTGEVLPRVEALQSYVWRRHLVSAGSRLLAVETPGSPVSDLARLLRRHRRLHLAQQGALGGRARGVAGVLREPRPWSWSSSAGGRIIKNIGDEVLFVTDEPRPRPSTSRWR